MAKILGKKPSNGGNPAKDKNPINKVKIEILEIENFSKLLEIDNSSWLITANKEIE